MKLTFTPGKTVHLTLTTQELLRLLAIVSATAHGITSDRYRHSAERLRDAFDAELKPKP